MIKNKRDTISQVKSWLTESTAVDWGRMNHKLLKVITGFWVPLGKNKHVIFQGATKLLKLIRRIIFQTALEKSIFFHAAKKPSQMACYEFLQWINYFCTILFLFCITFSKNHNSLGQAIKLKKIIRVYY